MGKLEIFDKSDFIMLALTYSATPTIIYEEVAIKGLHSQFLPNRIIDLVTFTRVKKDLALALLCCQDGQGASIDCVNVTTTIVETLTLYSTIGSESQAIVELWLLQSNPHLQCFVMLKVCRHCFKPYLPQYNILLCTKSDIALLSKSTSGDMGHDPIGSFILSLILDHLCNTKLFACLDKLKCGLANGYVSNKDKFTSYIYPQKYTTKVPNAEATLSFSSSKKLRVDQVQGF